MWCVSQQWGSTETITVQGAARRSVEELRSHAKRVLLELELDEIEARARGSGYTILSVDAVDFFNPYDEQRWPEITAWRGHHSFTVLLCTMGWRCDSVCGVSCLSRATGVITTPGRITCRYLWPLL